MKKILGILCLLLFSVSTGAQTHTFPAEDTNNTFTGSNTFTGTVSTKLVNFTVATLPSPASSMTGMVVIVTDGTSASDCIAGGGGTAVLCRNSGTAWVSLGGSSTSAGLTVNGPAVFKGLDPWADITAFGARAVSTAPTTTASCTSGSTTLTLATANYVNGDGVTVQGCGPTNTLTTPTAPVVTPSLAAFMTGAEVDVNSATGTTTYAYQIVARTKQGALTAASPQTQITTGQASLGLQSVVVTSASLTNDTMTLTMSGPTNIVAGTQIHYYYSNNAQFSGFFIVSSVSGNGATVVINNVPFDSRALGYFANDTTSTTGGTVAFFQCNHLSWTAVANAWEYYIYANRNGAGYALIGVTKPNGNSGWQDTQYDDYGATFTAGQVFPSYVPTGIPPTVATNNPLTTTIVSGAGTTSILVANAASQTATGRTIILDAAPAILAAAQSIAGNSPNYMGGVLYIPITGSRLNFQINSNLILPSNISIIQTGSLLVNETVEVGVGTNWSSDGANYSVPSFSLAGFPSTTVTAYPGVYVSGDANTFTRLEFVDNASNGGLLFAVDGSYENFEYANFTTGATNADYLSMSVMLRNLGTPSFSSFHKASFTGQVGAGGGDNTWTPLIYLAPGQNGSGGLIPVNFSASIEDCYFYERGFAQVVDGGVLKIGVKGSHRKYGIIPMYSFMNLTGTTNSSINLQDTNQDTDTTPLLYLSSAVGSAVGGTVVINGAGGPWSESGGVPSMVSGQRPYSLTTIGVNPVNRIPVNRDGITDYCGYLATAPYFPATGPANACVHSVKETIGMMANHNIFWPMSVPTSVTAVASGVGTWPSGTYSIAVTGVDPTGGETILSVPSSVVVNGSQGVQVTWINPLGTAWTNGYWCSGACTVSGGNWRKLWPQQTGTSIVLSAYSSSNSPNVYTTAGQTLISPSAIYTPMFGCNETTPPTGRVLWDLFYCDNTDHRLKLINNNGTASDVATLSDISNGITFTEGTAPTGSVNKDILYGDSTAHTLKTNINNSGPYTLRLTIATGITALGTAAIASGTCAPEISVAAPGVQPSDHIELDSDGADLSAITGYGGSTAGNLYIYRRILAGSVNFKVCNWTSTAPSITPGPFSPNWSVTR